MPNWDFFVDEMVDESALAAASDTDSEDANIPR